MARASLLPVPFPIRNYRKSLPPPVFETSEFSRSLYLQAKHMEENSYRVVITQFDIIFYLTKIEKGWYLTLFDRVTTDCSA